MARRGKGPSVGATAFASWSKPRFNARCVSGWWMTRGMGMRQADSRRGFVQTRKSIPQKTELPQRHRDTEKGNRANIWEEKGLTTECAEWIEYTE